MILKETRTADKRKAVIFCCDNNVVRFAQFVADQIYDLEPDHDFDICITTFDETILSDEKIPKNIRICHIDDTAFQDLCTDLRIPATAYIKLALPEIFADDYEQIVYLDVDVFLRKGKISDLFNEAPMGEAVAGVIDSIQWNRSPNTERETYWKLLGISGKNYMNTGVIVFDVAECNRLQLPQAWLKKARDVLILQIQNPHINFYHDQSAINACLKGNWTSLSLRWNWQTLNSHTAQTENFDPFIMHFIAETKPWLSDAVWYTAKYYPPYHNYFVEVLEEPLPYKQHAGFPERGLPGWGNLRFRELSVRKIITLFNSINPFRYTPLYAMLPRYRKRKLIEKMEAAIEGNDPTWPISELNKAKQ